MPRARISRNGIQLAKPGFNVDTATLANMILSPQFATMRIALQGYTTPVDFSGYVSNYHRRSIVTFPTAFPTPPLVLVSGIVSSSVSDQTQFEYELSTDQGGTRKLTHYSIETYTTHFELYTAKTPGTALSNIPSTWKYFVFANRGG